LRTRASVMKEFCIIGASVTVRQPRSPARWLGCVPHIPVQR
jgi:hypothetical protein